MKCEDDRTKKNLKLISRQAGALETWWFTWNFYNFAVLYPISSLPHLLSLKLFTPGILWKIGI